MITEMQRDSIYMIICIAKCTVSSDRIICKIMTVQSGGGWFEGAIHVRQLSPPTTFFVDPLTVANCDRVLKFAYVSKPSPTL